MRGVTSESLEWLDRPMIDRLYVVITEDWRQISVVPVEPTAAVIAEMFRGKPCQEPRVAPLEGEALCIMQSVSEPHVDLIRVTGEQLWDYTHEMFIAGWNEQVLRMSIMGVPNQPPLTMEMYDKALEHAENVQIIQLLKSVYVVFGFENIQPGTRVWEQDRLISLLVLCFQTGFIVSSKFLWEG